MEAVALIFGIDAGTLLLGVAVEMRLHAYHMVVVVDIYRLHPAVVGTGDVYFVITEPDAAHNGRNKHVTGPGHA